MYRITYHQMNPNNNVRHHDKVSMLKAKPVFLVVFWYALFIDC